MAPKRAAASVDVPDVSTSKKPVQKRTRFASPGDDPAEFAEEVDAALEDRMGTRRGRVKVEGYESDSTDDGEGVVESRKKKGKEDEDEDEDMFAMGEKEEAEEADTGKKKQEFLRLGDIEGQEFGETKGSGDELSDDEDDEPEDEDDAERRKKAGMGYELSSFNMREEMEEGKFDADGTYIRSFDEHAVHDRWMEGLDEKAIKKARKQKRIREKQERKKEAREERNAISKQDAERELVDYLQKGESVLEALQRLGVVQKKLKAKTKPHHPKKPPNGMEVDTAPTATAHTLISSPVQEAITRITDLSSALMSHGEIDIYSKTYEELLRSVRKEIGSEWVPPSQNAQYEYQWAVTGDGGTTDPNAQVYGPYKLEDMKSWYGADYFGDGGEKIRLRKVGDNNWHEWDEVIF